MRKFQFHWALWTASHKFLSKGGFMATISNLSLGIRLAVDFWTVSKRAYQAFTDPESGDKLSTTCATVALSADVLARLPGFDDKTRAGLKGVELLAHAVRWPCQAKEAIESYDQGRLSSWELVEDAALLPLFTLARTETERALHLARHKLELPQEEAADKSLPKLHAAEAILKGKKQVDPLDMYRRAAAQIKEWLRVHNPSGDIRKVSFEVGSFVPKALMDDEDLIRYECAITLRLPEDPVRDPNGTTIYERRAIKEWIQKHGTSPVTRRPLSEEQLLEAPDVRVIVNELLHFHQEEMQEAIDQGFIIIEETVS